MTKTVIKIEYVGGNSITFDNTEVDKMRILRKRDFELEVLQDNSPVVTILGYWYRIFQITLRPELKATLDNFGTLRSVSSVVKIYPKYNLDSDLFYYAKIDPRAKRYFFGGGRDGETPVNLNLVQYPADLVSVQFPVQTER